MVLDWLYHFYRGNHHTYSSTVTNMDAMTRYEYNKRHRQIAEAGLKDIETLLDDIINACDDINGENCKRLSMSILLRATHLKRVVEEIRNTAPQEDDGLF